MGRLPTLAVVGATSAVGATLCDLLSARKNVWGDIRLLALPRAAGGEVTVRGEQQRVRELSKAALDGADVVVFDVPDAVAAEWVPVATAQGAVAVDNSSVFRMDPDVPLVVPEINPEQARNRPKGIIANASCTTLTMIIAIAPLHREYGLRELVIASYQAASGTGRAGITALMNQIGKVVGEPELGTRPGDVRRVVGDDLGPFPAPLVLNVVPWAGTLQPAGWTSDELKVRDESRKILGLPDLKVSVTCVRVPVVTGHSEAVHAVFGVEVDAEDARDVLRHAPGVILVDDPVTGEFPMPIDAVGTDPSWAGRIRRSLDDPRALDLFVTGDNLRKGAALNTAQIGELLAAELSAG